MVRTQIQLTDDQVARLRRVIASENTSIAAAVREALEMWLAAREQPDRATLKRRAKEIAGMFDSGTPDLVERLDDYLAEAYES